MLSKLHAMSVRRALLGVLVLGMFVSTAPIAMALPKDDPPIPTPVAPTPMATPSPTPTPPPLAYAPDLIVERVQYGADVMGRPYTDVRIRNQGNRQAGPFYVREQNIFEVNLSYVGGLVEGSFADLRFYRSTCQYGWNVIVVDLFEMVEEFSESNNVKLTFRGC